MNKSRLEAFSDGVFAIIITISILGVSAPSRGSPQDALDLIPSILIYALSFLYVGNYWNNHHHLTQALHRVSAPVLWANLGLLFWLSLLPLGTDWMGKAHDEVMPVLFYGFILLMSSIMFRVLSIAIIKADGAQSPLKKAVGGHWKGNVSIVSYLASIPLCFLSHWIAQAIYLAVALMWVIPDKRIESVLQDRN